MDRAEITAYLNEPHTSDEHVRLMLALDEIDQPPMPRRRRLNMKTFLIVWALTGVASWATFDARYFNSNAFASLKYLAVQIVIGPLSWLRLCIPKM